MTAHDIQAAVARMFFPCRDKSAYFNNLLIPNVSWAFFARREADLIVITKKGYLDEIEIKVHASDIKADHKKKHNHEGFEDAQMRHV